MNTRELVIRRNLDQIPEFPAAIPKVSLDDIIGNRELIRSLKQGIGQLLCYEAESRSNVFNNYGFQKTYFIHGDPGTGKTTTIQAVLNYGAELAEELEKKLEIEYISNSFKSEYYSRSARNLNSVFNRIFRGDCCYVVIVEDIDTIFFEREGLHSQEDKANLGVFLNLIEGVATPNYGNHIIITTTNKRVDKALMQRLQECSIKADGLRTVDDFVRLFKIKLSGTFGFVEADWENVADICIERGFNGRDVKNLSKQISSEICDFDIPLELYPSREKEEIINELLKRVDEKRVIKIIEAYNVEN